MAINLLTMKCAECGSGALEQAGLNRYVCRHCGTVAMVEDDVSERLDRVLEQVKNAAANRLVAEQRATQEARTAQTRKTSLATVVLVGVASLLVALWIPFGSRLFAPKGDAAGSARSVSSAPSRRSIAPEGLKLEAQRQVLVEGAGSDPARLLVEMRNETGQPLSSPSFKVNFFDGEQAVGQASARSTPAQLQPGESVPVLVELPSGKNVTRQTLTPDRLSRLDDAGEGPALAFSRVRLVQQGDEVRLVGRIVNDRKTGSLEQIRVLVRLFDGSGELIGLGNGSPEASSIAPNGRSAVSLRMQRFAPLAPIAAWDYRIQYAIKSGERDTLRVLAKDATVRSNGSPEVLNAKFRLDTETLLADAGELFDATELELLPLVPGRSTIQRPLFLTELVNRSTDRVVLAPGAVISQFDGSKAAGERAVSDVAYLYPGERFPLVLEPKDANRITQTRVEYKPMRVAALPGLRVPLDVVIEGTKAEVSSVLLNFSQRFAYKLVEVTGSVTNPGDTIVTKTRLWVSLRDKAGNLSGLKLVDNLPAIGPKQSVPFQVNVEQNGRDFASVDTFYQTE